MMNAFPVSRAAVFLIVGILALPSALRATPASEQVAKRIADYTAAQRAGDNVRPDETVQALEKIIEAHPSDPAVLDALGWMFRHGRQSSGSDFPLDEAFYGRLLDHHVDDPRLSDILVALNGYPGEDLRAFMKGVSERSKDKDVRGFALFTLAHSYEFDDNATSEFEATLAELVEKHERLDYNGRDLMPKARSLLFAARNLGVGKRAPDIEGEDVDGASFKLSDYRGKITYVVFWGDW